MNIRINSNSISRTMKSVLLLLILAGSSFSQDESVDYFKWRVSSEPEVNTDKLALHVVSTAYLARFYDNYMPWWQADLLAFSSDVLWEIKDGLIPAEKAGFLGGNGFRADDLKYGATGIVLNRVLPIIVQNVIKLVKLPMKNKFSLTFNSNDYPELALSINL